VWEVVRDLNGDKAPGLDGFLFFFFFLSEVLGGFESRHFGSF
jgi:hypothetical protein